MIGALALHGALIVGMGVLYITTYTFPLMDIGGTLGPTFWPRTVALLGIGLTLFSAVQTFRGARRRPRSPEAFPVGGESDRVESSQEPPLAMRRFWVAVATFIVFVLALEVMGFAPTAVLLSGFYVWLVGLRSRLAMIGTGFAVGLGFAVLFGRVLQVSLPRGAGVFRDVSYFLY